MGPRRDLARSRKVIGEGLAAFAPGQKRGVALVAQIDPHARPQTVAPGPAPGHFEHVARRTRNLPRLVAQRVRTFGNPHHGAIGSQEGYVQRYACIMHPKCVRPFGFKIEDHAFVFTKTLSVHQPLFALRVAQGPFDNQALPGHRQGRGAKTADWRRLARAPRICDGRRRHGRLGGEGSKTALRRRNLRRGAASGLSRGLGRSQRLRRRGLAAEDQNGEQRGKPWQPR